MTGVRLFARRHTEAVAVAALLLGTIAFGLSAEGGAVPAPVYFLGLIGGATIALHAIGIILVYRASRVINFAQIQIGITAGIVFFQLVAHRVFVRGIAAICPQCLPRPRTLGDFLQLGGDRQLQELLRDQVFRSSFDASTSLQDPGLLGYFPRGFSPRDFAISVAPRWVVHLNYALSLLLAAAIAMLLLWALYSLVIRRFAHAPKLVLTVITIAAAFFLAQVGSWMGGLFSESATLAGAAQDARLPVNMSVTWQPVVFSAADILTLIVVCATATALALFLFRSRLGVVLRAASENPSRAETLGVNVSAVTARAWMLAGALSGIAAVLAVARTGSAPSGGGYDTFVRTLAAAVAGGLVLLPLSVIAGLVVGVADQVFAWIFESPAPLAAVLFGVIVLFLLVQRARAGRAEREAQTTWRASREMRPIPGPLRSLPPVRYAVRTLFFIIAVVTIGYPWFMSPSQTNIGVVVMVQAMIGLSLLVLTGWAGQISLGQMAFAAFGAWVAAVLGLPFPISVLAGALAGMLLAVGVGIPSLKLRGLHLAISTLALGLGASAILFDNHLLGGLLPRRLARPVIVGIDFDNERAFYYLVLAFVVATVVALIGLRRSAVARALIASKDNEHAAMSFGIDLLRARVTAFAISGFIAAAAGVLLAYTQHGVDPLAYTADTSISIFLMTLLGGLGSIAGPLIGALYLGTLRIMSGPLGQLLLNPGIGVILVLLVMPGGVVQGLYAMRDAWLRRLARRNRIDVPTLAADGGETGAPLPILAKLRATGGATFVPRRFRLDDQWSISARRETKEKERTRG